MVFQDKEFIVQYRRILGTMPTMGRGGKATYTRVQLLHRFFQSVGRVPGYSVKLALPVTDLANGIGHVLEDFRELVLCVSSFIRTHPVE